MKYFLKAMIILIILDPIVTGKTIIIECNGDCKSSFGSYINKQIEIISEPWYDTYQKDYAKMPGFGAIDTSNDGTLKVKKIYKKGVIDTELSFIFPQILKGVLTIIKEIRTRNGKVEKLNTDISPLKNDKIKELSHQPKGFLSSGENKISANTMQPQREDSKKVENDQSPITPPSPRLKGNSQKTLDAPSSNIQNDEHLKEKDKEPPANNIKTTPTVPSNQVTQPFEITGGLFETDALNDEIELKEAKNVFKKYSGTFYVYTFSSSCLVCLEKLISLTKIFPNVLFKMYYSKLYDNKSVAIDYFEEQKQNEIRKSFYYLNCKTETEDYLRKRSWYYHKGKSNYIEYVNFTKCIQKVYQDVIEGKIIFTNIEFIQVDLRKDIGEIYNSIKYYNYNAH